MMASKVANRNWELAKICILLIFMSFSAVLSANSPRVFTEHKIAIGSYQMYARDYAGSGPALILLHGFPDNHTLYDSLIDQLGDKRVIVFDFMGWGLSDKPKPKKYPYSDVQQELEIDAVVNYFKLPAVVLVPHDMSGPAAINWSLDHKDKSAGLIIMNTYYHESKNRRIPFTGKLLSIPVLRQFTLPFCVPNILFNPVLKLSLRGFFASRQTRKAFVPGFVKSFKKLSAKRSFFRTVKNVKKIARKNVARIPEVKQYTKPVCIIFGAGDKFLGKGMAEEFHTLFTTSELHLIKDAKHYPQIDAAKETGEIIMNFMNKNK